MLYGTGRMGSHFWRRLEQRGDVFRSMSRHDPLTVVAPDGRALPLDSVRDAVAIVCVPPAATHDLVHRLLGQVSAVSAIVDTGNTDPSTTATLAGVAEQRGLAYVGIGVASGPHLASTSCSATVGASVRESIDSIADVIDALVGPGGRHEWVGSAADAHTAKVLLNPTGYLCTAAAAGAASELIRQTGDLASTAARLRAWLSEGSGSYLLELAVEAVDELATDPTIRLDVPVAVDHSAVGYLWMSHCASIGYVPPWTNFAVLTRLAPTHRELPVTRA
ncbi:MAG: NAD(P)-binding domain-containing protein, partial [Ilumatobacteraceae bacterium]